MQKKPGIFLTIVLCVILLVHYSSFGQRNSVLAEGQWYKLAVTQDGIYKLDQAFLGSMGINTSTIDPRNIKIYGNGGKLLPQPNASLRPVDLLENAIMVAGEQDGNFGTNDYILFYGQDPDSYLFDVTDRTIDYINHTYSDTTYYFLRIDTEPGKRIESISSQGSGHPPISSFVDYQVHEIDKINLLPHGSGREWYEEILNSNVSMKEVNFLFPNIRADLPVQIKTHLLAQSITSNANIDLILNGQLMGQQVIDNVSGSQYANKAKEHIERYQLPEVPNNMADNIKIEIEYQGTGTVYLNYLLISAHRQLTLGNSSVFFRSWESLDNSSHTYFVVGVQSNTLIWDVTDGENIANLEFEVSESTAAFGTQASPDTLESYVVFNPDKLIPPLFVKGVANQDLQGDGPANLVIISPSSFLSEANRLADLRRSKDNLTVLVVTPEQIYNEFSSGAQDITAIRDYLKYLWDIDNSETGLNYALFFGKSSFDFKNRIINNTNFVPTYESYNSLHPIYSYSSDDYFGFMESDEGEWRESRDGDHSLDIGIGRIPVTSLAQAKTVVDKYYTYALDKNTFGAWKNTITFVADDEDNNLHQRQADRLTDTVERYDKTFNIKKIYLDAFKQEVIPGSEKSPEAYNFIKQTIDRGTFIVNFTGHGGERQWTNERILDLVMIEEWENEERLPIFVTATCEFGRHDSPTIISGAELALLRKNGGAIALVTTTRPVFATQNFELNTAFYKALLDAENENSRHALGDIFKETKNNSLAGSVNRNFTLLGDPSLQLSIPELIVQMDSITTANTSGPVDTLNALSQVNLRASVRDVNGNMVSNFNGEVDVILFEKPTQKVTLGSKSDPFEYQERDNAIFKGKATVINGTFNIEFVIPKNISYQFGQGKFSYYAYSAELGIDARGYTDQIVIGGSGIPVGIDNEGPIISVFMGDSTFRSGSTIKPNSLLVARLFDVNGINISRSGLGQDIQAILDNDEVFYLHDHYQADKDNYQRGWIYFPINELETGPHTITVKAWDTFNNPAEASIDFIVSEQGELVMKNLRNYPNPMIDRTNFTFEHNRAGEELEVYLQIFNGNGEVVKETDYSLYNSLSLASEMEWNGRNTSGVKLTPGIYFYKVIVRSTSDGASAQMFQKLILY